MFFETRQKHLENVINKIYDSKLYQYPHSYKILDRRSENERKNRILFSGTTLFSSLQHSRVLSFAPP